MGSEALLTDFYELTMLQAYLEEGMDQPAVFSLSLRKLPPQRSFILACGLEEVLHYLEQLSFQVEELDYLARAGPFSPRFLDWLSRLRFTGEVYAVPEGTPLFGGEPLLEVVAPLPQAQLVETYLLNQVHLETVLASKAARVVLAARGRKVVDFGLRRMQGADAGLKSARAFYLAGVDATSNLLAGKAYGIPVTGTMAHSYIQAHEDELEAFRAFASLYPGTTLLVDTYDTLEGVGKVIRLARELGPSFQVRGVRLDSGDLLELSRQARQMLDQAGLREVEIFASGGLDEYQVERLVSAGAPISGFGVGTAMGVSADAPSLDLAYKLVEYAGRGRFKLSPEKVVLPGQKQVFRVEEDGRPVRDLLGLRGEPLPGRPLLRQVMRGGRRTQEGREELAVSRARARQEIARLPEALRSLLPPSSPYPVELSPRLMAEREALSLQSGFASSAGQRVSTHRRR